MDSNGGANTSVQGGTRAAPPSNVAANPESRFSWRRWIRPVVFVIYGLLVIAGSVCIAIDYTETVMVDKFKRTLALVGFVPMVISIPLSFWGIINHMVCFTRPSLQKYIFRVLWMAPLYVLMSWLALRFSSGKVYFDALRQMYEALAMCNFVFYIVTYFAEEVPDLEQRLAEKEKQGLPIPLCRVKRQPTLGMIHKCKIGTFTYSVVRTIATIVTVILHLTGNYSEEFGWGSPYTWFCTLVTISQIVAMFSLNLLRMATYEELQPLPRFFKQFVAIHIVIFFTNYQGSILNLVAKTGVFNHFDMQLADIEPSFATKLQDLLICFEMVPLAAFFTYSFDYQRYNTNEPKCGIGRIILFCWTLTSMKSSVIDRLGKGNNTNEGFQNDNAQSQQQTPAAATDGVYPSIQLQPLSQGAPVV
ncbi:transmembrane protein 184C-like [Asterias amurensis]|uniref:transmembrane protein 184C-like n=1 Tax=Asterias amurensis TaxID=7602 RepID=UPI003AB298FA